MLLGIPLDYRNDYDFTNAIASFGKFISWHQEDVVKDQMLLYAAFNSPAQVPRDVVFGDYSDIGGVKETWTVPCYILSADFVDIIPGDEDPMPMDGNPHPLPGNLIEDPNMFVLPQFPEIWPGVQEFPNFWDGKFRKKIGWVLECESRKSLTKSVSRQFGFPIFRDRDRKIPKIPNLKEITWDAGWHGPGRWWGASRLAGQGSVGASRRRCRPAGSGGRCRPAVARSRPSGAAG